ncbi:MBL fold metallo-hydrolase [Aeromonas caviae]|uniref:ComEC/Rec2 family competence protein n=1 Tax=Aeromonas caviae TaxID=648 RepID=UPI0020B7ECB8|nr:MBL fold metallo-hydrolase [Aeromonas caviae]UTI02694.1 MBL fold metallo-hydrolase [Aeromonas caviae]
MGYEVDILAVGEKSNSGDAIAVRYGDLSDGREAQTVVVIDGGYKDDGARLVAHIKEHYQTERVDLVISTHPDQDHINGLTTVIEEMEVSELWIHKAWVHNQGIADKFKDGRVTDNSIGERLKDSLEAAYRLVELAESKGVTVREPFTGETFGSIKVLSPSLEYYEELIPQFDGMPEAKSTAAARTEVGFLEGLYKAAEKVMKKIFAAWGDDKIDDNDSTSAKNNSSVITQIIVDGKRLLFTGDAGITALDKAADQLESCVSGAKLRFMQIPHHGSKRNVGPSVLNRIIGEPVAEGESRGITAVASAAKEGEPKHPHKAVLNAFTHRGAKALATRGSGICHHSGTQSRAGWTSLNPEPYHYEYEEEA